MKYEKILVTGGAGFIGCNFIQYLFKKCDAIQVINCDKLTYAGNLANLQNVESNSNYKFVKGDICNKRLLNNIFKSFEPECVVNFAAETHVDRSIVTPSIFIKTNIIGTQNLLDISLKFRVEKYIQISTDEVYGSLGDRGYFTEDTPLNPHSPYSASKASADLIVKSYHDTYELPVNITRCSNNYGPYQFPEKLIPLTINNCLAGKKIPLYGNGLNVRDWLYVEDHCAAIDAVINRSVSGDIYNIGGNNELSNLELVKIIIQCISEYMPNIGVSEDLIACVQDRKGHDWRYAIDAAKIRRDLGWRPNTKFEDGIKKTYVFSRPSLILVSVENRVPVGSMSPVRS